MIKNLRDARIKDGVPKIIAKQDWVVIMSEVMGILQEKLLDFTDQSQIYTAIDTLPERLLDILAVNWKVEWYDNDYDIEQKRRVIKSAIQIRRQMGTVAAVRSTLESIFRSAKIVEWFESGGEPGTFEVEISSSFTQKDYETFTRLIDTTKRASAHLRSIRSVSRIDEQVHIGTILATDSNSPMENNRSEEKETYIQENVLLACTAEICECYESLFARKVESSFSEQASSVGTVLQCALTAQLYEHTEDQQELSTSGKIGASIGYVQSSLLQERSRELRTITSCVENGSVIETGTVQNLEE